MISSGDAEDPRLRAADLERLREAAAADQESSRAARRELDTFWDWACLELLVQSGLRVEEACELTTLDVLKRRLADGRVYYMLHVKPSKFDRARVLPSETVSAA